MPAASPGCLRDGVQGLGSWVQGLGFRVQGLGFRVQGLFRGLGSGFRGLGHLMLKIFWLGQEKARERQHERPNVLPARNTSPS